jgi:hypothetical protein
MDSIMTKSDTQREKNQVSEFSEFFDVLHVIVSLSRLGRKTFL